MRLFLGVAFRLTAHILMVLIILPLLYLIEPFYRIRMGTMYTQRVGHLAQNAENFLRTMQLYGAPKRTFYWFFGYDPANRQLFEMWKRTKNYPVRFVESEWGSRLMHAWRPILINTRFWEHHRITDAEYYLLNHTKPTLSFTEEEEKRGREELAKMGIGEDDWFVCFHARDAGYLKQWRPEQDWGKSETAIRHTDVMSFMKAAEYIASLGGFAIRFGAGVETALPKRRDPRIIDYAINYRSNFMDDNRGDFMDVYLAAKCRFFIASNSGAANLANIFNVPILWTSHFPFNAPPCYGGSMFLPQILSRPGETLDVSFWEAQEAGYFVGWDALSSWHETIDLFDTRPSSAEDILDGCMDVLDRLEGRPSSSEALEIQETYLGLYADDLPDRELAARVGPRFAVKYRGIITPMAQSDNVDERLVS